MSPEFNSLVRMELDNGILRAWTGNGKLTITEPLTGQEGVYDDSAQMLDSGGAVRFALRGRQLMGVPVSRRPVAVYLVGSQDNGATWDLLPFVRQGVLANPQLENGVYSVEVASPVYGKPATLLSHESHVREHAGDSFFSQMRALAKGIDGILFPNVPPWRLDGEYDRVAVSKPVETAQDEVGNPASGFVGAISPVRPGVAVRAGTATKLAAFATRRNARF